MTLIRNIIISIALIALAANAHAADQKKQQKKQPSKAAVAPEPEPDPETPLLDRVDPEKHAIVREMLDRVERITLIDTLHVDSVDFFSHYRLSADAGALIPGAETEITSAGYIPTVVYSTQSRHELMWAQPADSSLVITACIVLDDGKLDTPYTLIDESADMGGNSDYPFVMQDGYTVYFANNGDGSIGGYDIFMTRRSPDGEVLRPQNIGLPFNSPYNDYMMAIDETRNLGWWASDREQIAGKVTIYVFRPSEIRVNYAPETPDIEDIALLNIIDPVGGLDMLLVDTVDETPSNTNAFCIMVDGRQLTSLEQFANPRARSVMEQAIELTAEQDKLISRLAELRRRYAEGDKSVDSTILSLEKRLLSLPADIRRLTNNAVTLEHNAR